MASLMEDLLQILDQEEKKYAVLLELSRRKTPVIVEGDVLKLQKITDEEEAAVAEVEAIDKQRRQVMADIAEVTNKDVETLKLSDLIQILDKRPKERDTLAQLHDRLKATVEELAVLNDSNRQLIRQSLDMIDFNLSLEKAMRAAPETGEYTRNASIAGNMLGSTQGGFDAKQ